MAFVALVLGYSSHVQVIKLLDLLFRCSGALLQGMLFAAFEAVSYCWLRLRCMSFLRGVVPAWWSASLLLRLSVTIAFGRVRLVTVGLVRLSMSRVIAVSACSNM